ncbi:hypothetical protein SLE2022_374640 [Rubroshorea leprosula]
MEEDDPFGSIAKLCQVSSSQESLLRRCRFFYQAKASACSSDEEGDYNDPAYIPVDSTGITMVSPPESADNENMHLEDLFHTPPEGSLSADHGEDHGTIDGGRYAEGDTVPVDTNCVDDIMAVDLGRDTDLVFSEVEVEPTQRMDIHSDQNVAFQSELDEARVSKSKFSPAEQSLGESPFKRLKISSFESSDLGLATVQEKPEEEFLKSSEKLKSVSVSLSPIDLSGTSGKNTDFSETLELPLSSCEVGEGIHNSREELLKSSEISKSKSVSLGLSLRVGPGNVADEIRDSSGTLELDNPQNHVSNCETGEDIYTSREELLKSSNVSKSKSVSTVRSGNARIEDSFVTLELQNQQNHLLHSEAGEFNHAKRGVEFSTEVIDSEIEDRNVESCIKGISDGEKMNMEDIDKFRYTGANYSKLCEMEGRAKGKRVLPSRIYATVGAAALSKTAPQGAAVTTSLNTAWEDTALSATSLMIVSEGTAGNVSESDVLPEKKSTNSFLLDVLKALGKDDDSCNENLKHLSLMEVLRRHGTAFTQPSKDDDMCNENLKHLSLMEVVKRRGAAFTQPSWWPKEGLEVKK